MSFESLPDGAPLFLLPHMDDEVLGCGSALMAHAQRGDRISVLTVFDGALGNREGKRDLQLIAQREAELIASLGVLAPQSDIALWSWDLHEGHLPAEPDFQWAENRLVRLLMEEPIGAIYSPWAGDAHPDHQAVASLAHRTLRAMGHGAPYLRTYEVWSSMPTGDTMPIDSETWRVLREALACHESQWDKGRLLERFGARSKARAPVDCIHGQVYGRTLEMGGSPDGGGYEAA